MCVDNRMFGQLSVIDVSARQRCDIDRIRDQTVKFDTWGHFSDYFERLLHESK